MKYFTSLAVAVSFLLLSSLTRAQTPAAPVDPFNYVIGTQTFDPTYTFTKEEPLLETAEAIRDMGSNVIKFGILPHYFGVDKTTGKIHNVREAVPGIHSLVQLVRDEPTHHKVLDMPFNSFILWAHTFANDAEWRNRFGEAEQKSEYKEMYDLTQYLLINYNHSGKTFYLGHWEGDGWLRHSVAKENDVLVTPEITKRMIDWYNTRQRAIDDAKRDTPHEGVQVWHYAEVNHVKLAMNENRPALVNKVLPYTHVDFVSYSSYDTAYDPELLKKALSYIESKLQPKDGIPGKRVFVGEFGFPSIRWSPKEQDAKSRAVLKAALEWHCPFALYWEMFNNEIDKRGQVGFWLITDKGVKQPIYETYKNFYVKARQYVADFKQEHGRVPTMEEYSAEAVKFLNP